ncbi:MAG: transcription antitermination factor NusB [Synergistetes bacterium]|nr:transcription antitermination factor NusB [Synergistota bacterium]
MKRRRGRELALQVLFQYDFRPNLSYEKAIRSVPLDLELPEVKEFAEEIIKGVLNIKEEIDELLRKHTVGWKVDRMATVDRNILRIALYEILRKREDVPLSVAINEAVELAKKYGTEDSGKFVNGVLAKIVREEGFE